MGGPGTNRVKRKDNLFIKYFIVKMLDLPNK